MSIAIARRCGVRLTAAAAAALNVNIGELGLVVVCARVLVVRGLSWAQQNLRSNGAAWQARGAAQPTALRCKRHPIADDRRILFLSRMGRLEAPEGEYP